MVGLRQDLAIGRDAFRHAQPPLARNDRQGLVLQQVVHVGAEVAPDFEDVAKSFRRQQGRLAELVLQHRVGDEGGAVHEQSHVICVGARELDSAFDRGDERAGGVAAAARHLGDGDLAGLLVQHRDIGEGAANIDTYSVDGLLVIHFALFTSALRCSMSHQRRKHPAHPQSYRKRISLNSGSIAPRARPVLCNLLHVSPEAILHMPRQHLARREVGRERYEVAGHGIKRSALVEHNSPRVGRILRKHGCQS